MNPSTQPLAGLLTQEQIEQYDRDGLVAVPGLFEPEEMVRWKEILVEALKDNAEAQRIGLHVWFAEAFVTGLIDAMRDERMVSVLRQIVGPNIEFLSSKAVFKNGKTAYPSPWHQDWFYWGGAPKMSVWIALDDATPENGCLKFIPGTHTRVFDRKEYANERFENRIEDADIAGLSEITMTCKRGDAVFFHDLTVHASHPNTSGGDRWSFIATYRDGAVADESKVWNKSMVVSGESVNAHL